MNLKTQLQTIDGSKVFQSIAYAFLIGYGTAVAPLLVLAGVDFGAFMTQVMDRLWLLRFFSAGMTGAISYSLGQYFRAPFDKSASSTPPTLRTPLKS